MLPDSCNSLCDSKADLCQPVRTGVTLGTLCALSRPGGMAAGWLRSPEGNDPSCMGPAPLPWRLGLELAGPHSEVCRGPPAGAGSPRLTQEDRSVRVVTHILDLIVLETVTFWVGISLDLGCP